jgi:hypothetical protein
MNHNPPKAEVTGSNPVGCANYINLLPVRLALVLVIKST